MKKLLTVVAVAMLGIAANAATYKWELKAGWVSPDDDVALEGATVYAFDANAYSSATLLAALNVADDNGATALANALGSGVVDGDGAFDLKGTGLTDNGGDPKTASMYGLLVMDDGSGNLQSYLMDGVNDVKISSAIEAGATALFNLGDVVTGEVGGNGWSKIGGGATPTPGPGSDSVPEPTSGILLVLGMAGLALRRRNA